MMFNRDGWFQLELSVIVISDEEKSKPSYPIGKPAYPSAPVDPSAPTAQGNGFSRDKYRALVCGNLNSGLSDPHFLQKTFDPQILIDPCKVTLVDVKRSRYYSRFLVVFVSDLAFGNTQVCLA